MDPAWTAFSTVRSDSNQYIYSGQSPIVLVDPLGLLKTPLGDFGGSIFNFGDCCILISQNNQEGPGQKQQWVPPGRIVIGISNDVDAVYFDDGSAVKIPDTDQVVVWGCPESASSIVNIPANFFRVFDKLKSKILPDKPAQTREFGPIVPPDPVCVCP